MMSRRLSWTASVAVAAPLVSQIPAHAGTIGVAEVAYEGYRGASEMKVWVDDTRYRGGAGAFQWSVVSVVSDDDSLFGGNEFLSFCIEVMENVDTSGSSTYQVVDAEDAPKQNGGLDPMGAARADLLGSWFTSHYMGDTWGAWGATQDEQEKNATAFQLGVWEIVYENAQNLMGNAFSVSDSGGTFWAEYVDVAGAITLADSWLTGTDWWNATPAHLAALSSRYQNEQGEWVGPALQDQVFVTTPTPSAALAGVMLCGLLGAGALFRRPDADAASRS